jgi:hypothetical protein
MPSRLFHSHLELFASVKESQRFYGKVSERRKIWQCYQFNVLLNGRAGK